MLRVVTHLFLVLGLIWPTFHVADAIVTTHEIVPATQDQAEALPINAGSRPIMPGEAVLHPCHHDGNGMISCAFGGKTELLSRNSRWQWTRGADALLAWGTAPPLQPPLS